MREGEDLVTEPKQILEIAREYYADLYKDREEDLIHEDILEGEIAKLILPQLSEDDRATLDRPFSMEELFAALSELNPNKSPGSDGIPPEFYRKFWPHIKRYFCDALQDSISSGKMKIICAEESSR